ncbi:uncharacterized protein MYCFIDRAFT_178080 [Pseudocercospora fijiensis CIRAD86]|uniref:Uncharacterized protein n=1 Tax=Pseudocercospora fijiensis (strain CIRAD86) TaxID=383855 RepID=M3A4E2_PSEFD|nr:uncharacterized protein MYCFIDRAFT_178080 [Pseudocercospora fijiensis CIRAD86]EME79486.1 hypothetical protein MYCFIDRAFT_178080 [Pseudocercospora fijiensis CIRAD86]
MIIRSAVTEMELSATAVRNRSYSRAEPKPSITLFNMSRYALGGTWNLLRFLAVSYLSLK